MASDVDDVGMSDVFPPPTIPAPPDPMPPDPGEPSATPGNAAAWLAIAGAAYVANSVVHFLAPAFGAQFFRYVLVPCGLGELVLIVWLLVFGLNEEQWKNHVCTPCLS